MTPELAAVFWALALFEVKHFLCDYVLQSEYMWRNKGFYGHPGGFIHAGIHAAGSLVPVLVLTQSPLLIAELLIAEFAVHYHCDWLKEQKIDCPVVDHYTLWTQRQFSVRHGVADPNRLWPRMSDAIHPGAQGHLAFYRELAPLFDLPRFFPWEQAE